MVINRWHDNVNAMFGERYRLDPSKDSVDFIEGSLGSYPNMFFVIKERELPDFFNLLESFDGSEKDIAHLLHYAVTRDDPNFWKHFDWFQNEFYNLEPLEAGLYDLNRYYYKAGLNHLKR